MRALIKLNPKPGLTLNEVEKPKLKDNEVLIKIKTTSLCGTDLHIVEWNDWAKNNVPTPLIIGHEFMGEIVELGKSVKHLKLNARVSGEGHLPCGHCHHCRVGMAHLCPNLSSIGINRPGAFADYMVLPADNVIELPDFISDDLAAILDPFGNAVHTALSFDLIGEDVLITGAGPIGLMTTAIAKHIGARHIVVTDIHDTRLELAKKMGATRTVNVLNESLLEIVNSFYPEKFAVGLEMSGQKSAYVNQIQLIRNGGSLGLLGLSSQSFPIEWNTVIFKGLTLKGIYGRKMYDTWDKMLHLLRNLDISNVITHHFKVEEYEEALSLAKKGLSGKILIHWE